MSRLPVREVFVATHSLNDVVALLQKSLPHVTFHRIELTPVRGPVWLHKLPEEDIQKMKSAEILLTDNQTIPQVAEHLPHLKWVQGSFAGIELALKGMRETVRSGTEKLPFVTTRFSGDKFGQLMFEYALSFVISNERGFSKFTRLQSQCDWTKCLAHSPVSFRLTGELTIAVLGLGAIGSFVTKSFKRLGCRVKGFSRSDKDKKFLQDNGVDDFSTSVKDVIRDTDYIINILPHSRQTIKLLDDVLWGCNKSPVLINMGRGSIVSENSLLSALDGGQLSAAVLDVFQTEPLPANSPLWTHPRILITPHVAGPTRIQDLAQLFVQNYHLFQENKPLKYEVDWCRDY